MNEWMIRCSVCTAADIDEVARLLGEAFAHRDPPAMAVGLTPAEFEAFVRVLGPRVVADALTIVARSAETGELMGALVTEDLAAEPPAGMEHLSGKFDPIFDLLGELDRDYRASHSFHAGEVLHLYLLGVDRRFSGRGVGHQLVAACLANGATRHYRRAVTEATSPTSQHIFRKQGFVEKVRRSYRDHRFGGQAVFASIAEHGGPILMEHHLATSDPDRP